MSPKRFSFIIGAALLITSCADDMPGNGTRGDGSISFSVDRAAEAVFSRAGGDAPTLSFHKTLPVEAVNNQNIWIHIESAQNPASFLSPTRSLPVSLEDMEEFNVTALLPDGNKFIDNHTVVKESNRWITKGQTYYWPQQDELSFYCLPTEHPEALTNLQAADLSYKFDYEVPVSEDGLTDADVQPDFVMATHKYSRDNVTDGVAQIRFQHPLAGICFVQDESLSDENLRIVKVELSGLYGKGSCIFNGSNPANSNVTTSKWTLDQASTASYAQSVTEETAVEVPVSPAKSIKAIAQPFMVLPHTPDQLAGFSCKVTLKSGDVRTASLSGIAGLEPGRMYVITLSGLDAKYPPVENLQGMAGNGTVSLNWDNPEETFEHIKQCGVTIEIVQKGQKSNGEPLPPSTLKTSIHWEDSHEGELFPSNKKLLDLFAYVKEGVDKDGNVVAINTRIYNEFECHVYADYYNTDHQAYKDNNNPVIHQSIPRTITIKPGITDDKVLFYIPEGAGAPEGLIDDDDVAAWDWFKRTYPQGEYVTKADLAKKQAEGFSVLWVPCGVQLRDGGYGTSVNATDADNKIKKAEEILNDPNILPLINLDTKENTDRYWDYKRDYAGPLQELGHVPGVYDDWDSGTIKRFPDVKKYFTDADIKAIRDFYGTGGNLLLTTFSMELLYEFEVITAVNRYYGPLQDYPYRPNVHYFNEIKPSSIWFIRPDFGDHKNAEHPIYSGMFKCQGWIFPEAAKDIFDGESPVFVASDADRKVDMFPLLSMGASACENNNVVWDFNHIKDKNMKNLEDDNNAKFIGTWGQIDKETVGVAIEFYPGPTEEIWPWNHPEEYINKCWCPGDATDAEKERIKQAIMNHGRCIAIGLGAYEFNNGLKYDPDWEVLNSYQSNVQLMTRNALNYLMNADPTTK